MTQNGGKDAELRMNFLVTCYGHMITLCGPLSPLTLVAEFIMAGQEVSNNLKKSLPTTRFPAGLWTVLILPYLPIGIALCLLRVCMSLQAILLLLIFPDGVLKRFMLRVFFTVLGILVITDGKLKDVKLLVSNKLTFVDHIVLHLTGKCISVSTGGHVPPLGPLFPHWTFPASSNEELLAAAKALPEFSESVVDYSPYAIQPEPLPTNATHTLLKFSSWPFSLGSPVQPVALSVFRPFPIAVSTVYSSGWWDLMWMLFNPITIFHAKFLQVIQPKESEPDAAFPEHVQEALASALNIQSGNIVEGDVQKWLTGPPSPKFSGPIIGPLEFDPSSRHTSAAPSELDTMVHQVTAVMPQVPYTIIRKDLMITNSVDATITNLLEGRVKYSPSSGGSTGGTSASQVFRRKVTTPSLSQRQLSLEERKRDLLQNARRKYVEKHGL